MPEFNEVASKAQDQVLSTIDQVREANVSAVATIAKPVAGLVPELPRLPGAERLPTAREVVDVVFDFGHKLLDAQKTYVVGVLDALAPVTEKVSPHPKARKQSGPSKSPRASSA